MNVSSRIGENPCGWESMGRVPRPVPLSSKARAKAGVRQVVMHSTMLTSADAGGKLEFV